MFRDILKRLNETETYVGIYTNKDDTEAFLFGKIIYLDAVWFAMELFLPDGRVDGILVKQINTIFRIETDSKYIKKMECLIKQQKATQPVAYSLSADAVSDLLQYAQKRKCLVSIKKLTEEAFRTTGFVIDLGREDIRIVPVDEYGAEGKETTVHISDIAEICCDSADEKLIQNLCR